MIKGSKGIIDACLHAIRGVVRLRECVACSNLINHK